MPHAQVGIHGRTTLVWVVVVCLWLTASTGFAQQPAVPDPAAMRVFASAADISALVARAQAERESDQPNFVQPVLRLPPYTLNLEYRVAGLNATASAHNSEAEIFLVLEGSGVAVTGGRLRDEMRRNAENLSGSGIEDGESQQISKGDVLFVPEKTPHWFSPSGSEPLILLSLHVPRSDEP